MNSEVTAVEFLEMIQQGQGSFSRLCGVLTEVDLSNLNFEECLFSVNFAGSNFQNSRFINSNLKACIFTNCIFNNAVLVGNSLDGTDFSGAKVDGMTFKDNTIHSIVLTESHLAEMIL
ncbi:pentapeptide repeat-containing protein [Paenibacillus sp. NRS-1760]|uniref:pentapeptide repeat-containing protein n=1 Tax=Paenibacillus sp. NRS-1760 TaxID=3233902 RepID=UPI003D2E7F25